MLRWLCCVVLAGVWLGVESSVVLSSGAPTERLLMVPAGAEVRWLMRQAPHRLQYLATPAGEEPVEVLGDPAGVLAVWYRTGDTLTVLLPGQAEPLRTLSLRTASLQTMSVFSGHPYDLPARLLPLLPVAPWERPADVESPVAFRNLGSEAREIALPPGTLTDVALWSTCYLAQCPAYSGVYTLLDGTGVAPALAVPFDDSMAKRWPMPLSPVVIRVYFPAIDYAALRKHGALSLGFAYDTGDIVRQHSWLLTQRPEIDPPAPRTSAALSIEWLGVGVMRNVPIPPPAKGQPTKVTLPAWQTGASISGTVQCVGQPLPHAKLVVRTRASRYVEERYVVTTDAQGRFTVTGLLPGPVQLFLLDYTRGEPSGWTVDVPADGLRDVALTAVNPQQAMRRSLGGFGSEAQAWWLPQQDRPLSLPCWGATLACQQPPVGPGRLWYAVGGTGWSRLAPVTDGLTAGAVAAGLPTPSLGLYLPLDPARGMPGAVSLIGLGPLDGLRLDFPQITWRPSTLLGQVTGQIDTVPPGTYRVLVNTPAGRTETTVTVTQETGGVGQLAFPAK